MNFDSIGEAPIYWCTFCGEQAADMDMAIMKAFNDDPNFAAKFAEAINKRDKHNA